MKFLLQIEVEAPVHTGNPDYPRAVYAIQRLQDWLKEAKTAQLHYLMEVHNPKHALFNDSELKKAHKDAIESEVAMIDTATCTVTEIVP